MEELLELIPLYSGSSGNAILVKANGLNLLFDVGQNCKKVSEALVKVGTLPENIDAVFLSHSHSDHIKGVDVFMRKYSIPVYATEPTHGAVKSSATKPHAAELDFIIGEKDRVEFPHGVEIVSCSTPHDCRGSVCYRVETGNKSAIIMTDLGHVTEDIARLADGVNLALIESNYDEDMLINGPYDYVLKRRVGGPYGHLSNVDCAKMMATMIERGTSKFILGHLSQNNNTPGTALNTVVEYLYGLGLERNKDYTVEVANRYEPTEGISV